MPQQRTYLSLFTTQDRFASRSQLWFKMLQNLEICTNYIKNCTISNVRKTLDRIINLPNAMMETVNLHKELI